MIEFYQYDGTEYAHVGTIDGGEVTGDVDWVLDFIEQTDDVSIGEEDEVIQRVSNHYFVGVIPGDGERDMSAPNRDLQPWEQAYDEVFEGVVWGDDPGRSLFTFDPEDVPAFAIENLREAVLAGALFADIDAVPDSAREAVKATMLDSLEERHGWSLDSISENLREEVPDLTKEEAERLARTETAAITNSGREIGYGKQFDTEAEQFYWQGPENDRTTDACSWLKRQTNPQFGGTPVSLSRLKELIDEAPSHDADLADDMARPEDNIVHINERHTFVRATGAV